ncbi:uncharacterized protein LOC128553338 [Mercenaria mercenaria]|uniref:uncharacterized protein LOC128553338 n=1 Tax=Mercenaria mercenaria TaxID=6596 RepID=UPI00234FB128|nr:uncharacterized protein LOC128553338 [Mercenaria mercenaria]
MSDFIPEHSCSNSNYKNTDVEWRTIYERERTIEEKDVDNPDAISTSGSDRFLMPRKHNISTRLTNCSCYGMESNCADNIDRPALPPSYAHSTEITVPRIVITEDVDVRKGKPVGFVCICVVNFYFYETKIFYLCAVNKNSLYI